VFAENGGEGVAMDEVLTASATRQAQLVREKKISSVELVECHLKHIAAVNPQINAAVGVFTDEALRAASAADQALARGEAVGPLHGVPFSVKDSIQVAGAVCTAGTIGRRCAPPAAHDATVVARLRRAGAIPLARTNLPDLLFAFESDNLLFGATTNPYDPARTSGGSSGGEAALIAACGSPLGLGSDCAGSVRVPSAFCGIAGIKPTSGRLPRTGHFPPAGNWIEALWQIGPMARQVEDLRTVLPLLSGPDGQDFNTCRVPCPDCLDADLRQLRVAWYTDNGFAAADAGVSRVVCAAAKVLDGKVAAVEKSRPVCLENAYDLAMKLIGADGGDSLRMALERVGSSQAHPLLLGWLAKLEPYRTTLAGFQSYWAEWDSFRAEMSSFFRGFDAILCPVYTHVALLHGTSTQPEYFPGFSHTMAYNLTGWPAAVVRCGEDDRGLPIAVQVVARPWREDVALAVAGRLEQALGGWKAPTLGSSNCEVKEQKR
jgi:amidase